MRRQVRRSRRRRLCLGAWRKEEDPGAEDSLEIDARADSWGRNSRLCRGSKRRSLDQFNRRMDEVHAPHRTTRKETGMKLIKDIVGGDFMVCFIGSRCRDFDWIKDLNIQAQADPSGSG